LPGIEELALPDDLVAQIADYVELMEALELNELWEFDRACAPSGEGCPET
jgi:hypothetical protein